MTVHNTRTRPLQVVVRGRQRAGGYRITNGCRRFPNFKQAQRQPWINATRQHILDRLLAGDLDTFMMIAEANKHSARLKRVQCPIDEGHP